VPTIRAFRALRYVPDVVGDLADVVSPPYDVISAAEQQALLARHPKNIVRLDLPTEERDDEPDDRYRRAARTFAAWRSDGTFHRDPRPAVYAYEQAYRVPGSAIDRVQRGFFARLRLEAFAPGGGVLPHERTMSAPKEDRYKLLRATGANMSPVVGLYADETDRAADLLAEVATGPPAADVTDGDGVRHRLWMVPAPADDDGATTGPAAELIARASAAPITIADGHHRYETALRYRDERRMSRSCEEDPPFDYILMLFLDTAAEPLTVLPTHRVIRALGNAGGQELLAGAREYFDVRPVAGPADLEATFSAANGAGGGGRFGLWTRAGGAVLVARRGALSALLPDGGEALRWLDVTLLGVALERLARIDREATAQGGRIAYTKSVAEAVGWVEAGTDGADAAFLLEPTPIAAIAAVAADGDVMPQKSTYFYPKPLSGLVINPHEW
jgi:uncharacterized protein (DUF1015 family)